MYDLYTLLVLAIGQVAPRTYKNALHASYQERKSLLQRSCRPSMAFGITFFLPGIAAQYERVHTSILRGEDNEAMAFKKALTNEGSMTAIAVRPILHLALKTRVIFPNLIMSFAQGAIIAQVSITALTLPFLNSAHWTARAGFLLAIFGGCCSVSLAFEIQRLLSRLDSPQKVRNWLTLPREEGHEGEQSSKIQRTVSLAAVLVIKLPYFCFTFSIHSLLVGFIIYQGYVFIRNLDPQAGHGDSRNVFVVLILILALYLIMFAVSFRAKDMQSVIWWFQEG